MWAEEITVERAVSAFAREMSERLYETSYFKGTDWFAQPTESEVATELAGLTLVADAERTVLVGLKRSDFDSGILGREVLDALVVSRPPVDLPSPFPALLEAMGGGPSTVHTRVPSSDLPTISMLLSWGFAFVGTFVGFTLATHHASPPGRVDLPEGTSVRRATEGDLGPIGDIGRDSVQSRFHADDTFDPGRLSSYFETWARNSIQGRGDENLVVERAGRVVGFASLITWELGGRRIGHLDLIAIDRAERGRGLGHALLGSALAELWDSHDHFTTGTQASNNAMVHVFRRLGYVPTTMSLSLHLNLG